MKIKDIHDRLLKNPQEYIEINFSVAKRIVSFAIMLYFTSLLFTIGGFTFFGLDIGGLAALTQYLYTAMIIVIGWFLFHLTQYGVSVYFPTQGWLRFAAIFCASAFTLFALFAEFQSF